MSRYFTPWAVPLSRYFWSLLLAAANLSLKMCFRCGKSGFATHLYTPMRHFVRRNGLALIAYLSEPVGIRRYVNSFAFYAPPVGAKHLCVILAGCVLVAGCSVAGNDEGVWIKHPANQFIVASQAAEEHCEEVGKLARHLSTSEERNFDLFIFTSRISLFACDPS